MLRPLLQPLLHPLLRRIDEPAPSGLVPSLYLNFLSGSIDPRITFTRASGATRINAAGQIEAVAANVPRFDYDPVTLAIKGFLIEEQRTNLYLQSQFASGWSTSTAATISSNSAIAPDGTNTAASLVCSLGAAQYTFQSVLFTSGATYAVSCFVKYVGRSIFTIQSFNQSGSASFNILTGDVISVAGIFTSQTITPAGNGWYRCTAVGFASATGLNNLGFSTSTSVFVGTAFSLWGAQLEAGALPTSYIPTTSAAATRAADVAVMTGTNFSSWYRQDEGTLFAEFVRGGDGIVAGGGAATPRVWNSDDGTNSLQLRLGSSVTIEASSNLGTYIARVWTANAVNKSAMAYKTDNSAFAVNSLIAFDSAGSVSQTMTSLKFGVGTSGTGGFLNGHIRRLAFFPRRLANSELQVITQ